MIIIMVADEPDVNSSITYNVELPRFAGRLGISLRNDSNVESGQASVVIAGLTADGLAEKLVHQDGHSFRL